MKNALKSIPALLFGIVLIVSLGFVFSFDVKADPAHENVDNNAGDPDTDCTYCHNKEVMTRPDPDPAVLYDVLIEPDTPTVAYTGSTDRDFCVACHDDDPPAGVVFVSSTEGFSYGYNKSGYVGSAHETNFNNNDCGYCHTTHGPGSEPNTTLRYSRIKANYLKDDLATYSSSNFQLCWTNCHIESAIASSNNSFASFHNYHFTSGEETTCIMCHDVHGPGLGTGEGLVSFDWAASGGWLSPLGGYDLTNCFDNSTNTGYCYITCHGKNHSSENYSRSSNQSSTTSGTSY